MNDKSQQLLRAMRSYLAFGGGGNRLPHAHVEDMAVHLGISENQVPAVIEGLAKSGAVVLHYGEIELPLEKPNTGSGPTFNLSGTFQGPVSVAGRDMYLNQNFQTVPPQLLMGDLAGALTKLREVAPSLPADAGGLIGKVDLDLVTALNPQTPVHERKTLISRAADTLKPLLQHGAEIAAIVDCLLKLTGAMP